MSKKTLISYSHAFLVAAAAHARAAKEKGVDGEVDGMMCIIALQNAVVGATKVLGKDHDAVQACLIKTKDLKDVRDMLTHFDDYVQGVGKLQKSLGGVDSPPSWMPMWNSHETVLILTRRRGEVEPRIYKVSIHEALKVVAELIAVAVDSLDIPPSLLLNNLTGRRKGGSADKHA